MSYPLTILSAAQAASMTTQERLAHTTEFLTRVHGKTGATFEIRTIGERPKVISGLFKTPRKAALFAKKIAKDYPLHNVYYSVNRPGSFEKTSYTYQYLIERERKFDVMYLFNERVPSDKDYPHISVLPIDLDPVRPKGVCSTDEELAAALDRAREIRTYLQEHGAPESTLICSGNGAHLLLHQHHSVVGTSARWRMMLRHLAARFTDNEVDVDQTVFNPSRILRLPGTLNHKGPNDPERPHRLAHVIAYPASQPDWSLSNVMRSMGLDPDAATSRRRASATAPGNPTAAHDDVIDLDKAVEQLFEFYPDELDLDFTEDRAGVRYHYLSWCPIKGDEHVGGGGQYRKTAIIVSDTGIGFKCFSSDCADYDFLGLLAELKEDSGRRCPIRFWRGRDSDPDVLEEIDESPIPCEWD